MFKFGIFVTLIIRVFYSVQGQSLSFCENPIEGQTCQITCTTPDHNQAVSFLKTSTVTTIGTCSGGTCGASPPFIISQPTGTTTVLSFTLTRNDAEEWQCDYGSLQTTGTLKWGTYPTSITANGFPTSTTITTEQEVDVKLECLYSESPPTVTLYHTSSASISTSPIAPVTCTSTADVCTDPDFTTYTCKVKISPSDQLDCSETYSLGVYVKISNVETVSNSSALGSGITYECKTLSTHLDSTSDESRSLLRVTTDGGINSLNTLSILPDETMILRSILPTAAETSYVLSQTEASSDMSFYHNSNTHTTAFLMTTLTTSILDVFNNLFKSISNIRTSEFSILRTRSVLYNFFSTVDDLESSNLRSFSRIHNSDITNGISPLNMISSSETRSLTSALQSLTSFSHFGSLALDLRSQLSASPFGIVSTQKEAGSHIDNTSLTSLTYSDNSQLSLEISYQQSLSPSFASHLTGLNTQSLLCNHSMQSGECLTIPTTLSNPNTNSMLSTIFTHETSKLYSSSKYFSIDLKSLFDYDSKTKIDLIGTGTSNVIETQSENIGMNYDYSSDMLISSPITTLVSTPGTLIVRPTKVDGSTYMVSKFETFEDRVITLSVNSFQTQPISESETVSVKMNTSVETSIENIGTLFESSWIVPSTSLNHIHAPLSLLSGVQSDSVSKSIGSDSSVLFDSFSILPEKDSSNNILLKTQDVVVWSGDAPRISLGSLSRTGPSSYDSIADTSTKYMLSISLKSERYSLATSIHVSQQRAFVSSILPSVSTYFYSNNVDTTSSSLFVSAHPVLTYGPSLTKTSKVIAISISVVGCILFVAITILILFVLKLLQCKPQSKVSKTNKKFSNNGLNNLSISIGERHGISLFDKPYGLPIRYYDKTATSLGFKDSQFSCAYNKNWDDIT